MTDERLRDTPEVSSAPRKKGIDDAVGNILHPLSFTMERVGPTSSEPGRASAMWDSGKRTHSAGLNIRASRPRGMELLYNHSRKDLYQCLDLGLQVTIGGPEKTAASLLSSAPVHTMQG